MSPAAAGVSAAPDELRSALRTFRAGLAGAYLDEPAVLEASFRAAVARHGTAEAARMARTGHPEVGTLRPARTVAERARLLRMAEGAAAAGQRAFELLGAPRGAPRAAATRVRDATTARIAAISAELGPDGVTRHRQQILDALAAAPPERRAELAAALVIVFRNVHPMTPDGEILPLPRRGP